MNWRFGRGGWWLLPGGLITLAFAGLLKIGALQPLEQIAYNTLFRLRGEVPWDDRVVLVAIDDASLEQIGRFPWSRKHYIQLLKVLSESDPSVIAIDLVWSEPSPDDTRLAKAMSQFGRVVLAQAQDGNGFPLQPVPQLQSAAITTGHIFKQEDSDGITRKAALQLQDDLLLALAAVKTYSLIQAPVSLPALNRPYWINWPGPVRELRQYSFADVVQGKVPPQAFQNKIVLVGVTAVGLDALITPFNRNPAASGVHLHAAVINNLLQQNPLHPLSQNWLVLCSVLLVGGPGFSLLLSRFRDDLQLLIWAGSCTGWVILSLLLFRVNYWLPMALPLSLFTCTTITVAVGQRLRMNALLQQQVQHLWQRYEKDLVFSTATSASPLTAQRAGPMQSVDQLTALAEQFGRSQSTQAAIARNLSIGLLAANCDGVVWFCNPVAADWLKIQVGDRLYNRLVPDWMSEDQWQSDLQILQQKGQSTSRELPFGDRWFEIKLEPLTYQPKPAKLAAENQLDGLLVLLENITARKQVEEALEKQVEELQRLSQLKDDFLSTVSHELRAPMTNIRMAIELLRMPGSRDELDYYVQILDNECTRETNLINDLLDLQRLEAGAEFYEPVTIDLKQWLPPVIEPFYRRASAQKQVLQIQMPSQLPYLISDQPSLERIMVELVNNACKYTPPDGEITVAASWTPAHVELVVKNSGAEIPETELPRIFEKFYRVPKADPWKRGGTGLGLALVKKLVERMGGKILVKSGSGQTTFIVQLPLTDSQLSSVHQS